MIENQLMVQAIQTHDDKLKEVERNYANLGKKFDDFDQKDAQFQEKVKQKISESHKFEKKVAELEKEKVTLTEKNHTVSEEQP